MGNQGTKKNSRDELNSLVAAGLICEFQQISQEEIYGKAMKCFDLLMDVLDNPFTARRISAITNSPVPAVKASVLKILDLLLFNTGDDPHMSLCLPRYARGEEVTRRWKRMIVFFHPDRNADRMDYSERAKKINEAYRAIQKTGKDLRVDEAVRTIIKKTSKRASLDGQTIRYFSRMKAAFCLTYLRRLPAVILGISLLITIISILLFIYAG